MLADIQTEFLRAVRAAGCLQHGETAVLGVSGGADSLSMLHLFAAARAELGIRLAVLHLNHHIRGADAEADAAFVATWCHEWDIPCKIAEADVPALAREGRMAIEAAARQARYRALAEEAKRVGARVIAVAHNADDQAETVLMHFLRGSGLAGLRGMLPVTPLDTFRFLDPTLVDGMVLLRPLLGIPRAEIEAYCAANQLTPRIDQTNFDTSYTRNRLRHEVMPLLEGIAPGLRDRLGNTASILAADHDQLQRDLDDLWPGLLAAAVTDKVQFDLAAWRVLSRSMQRAALRRAAALIHGKLADIGFAHIEEALRIAQDGAVRTRASLPGGLVIHVGYSLLIITHAWASLPEPDWPLLGRNEEMGLAAPCDVSTMSGWRFSLAPYTGVRSGPAWDALLAEPWSAVVTLPAEARADLRLRARREGERFQPQGAGGSQPVHKFMINAKIPAEWRDRIPLLAVSGEIAWVCGWRVDERFVVTADTEDVWLARFEKGE